MNLKKSVMRSMAHALALILLIFSAPLMAQGVGISATGTPPHPSAGLDINFMDKGLLLPRLTTTERNNIVNPASGLIIFNQTTHCLEIFISSVWQSVFCGCAGPPTGLTYANNQPTYCLNNQIISNIPNTQVSTPSLYAISPALPQGLVLNMTTGEITGTPTQTMALSNFIIQASNACGTASCTLPIRILSAPSQLNYSQNGPLSYCTNQAILPNNATTQGGLPDTFTVTPSLPAGLVLNGATGQVTGTPTTPVAPTNFTITAQNPCGSSTRVLNITVTQTPAAPLVSSNSPVNLGATLQLNASPVSGVAFQWSGPNGFSSTNSNPSISCMSSAQQGNYTALATLNNCSSAVSSVSVTVLGLSSIPGLALWLDASAISNTAPNAQVSAWLDLSGNNRHANSTNWPTFQSNAINGKSVLRFTTAQHISVNHHFPAPYTILYVAKQTSGARKRVLTSGINNWLLGWWDGAKRQAFFEGWVSNSGSPPADDNVYLYTGVSNGSQAFFYENGNLAFNNNNGVAGPNGIAVNTGAFPEQSTCEVAEIIVFNNVLSTTNRVLVENYLKCKWGIP
jgi:hypothetical protein